MRNPLPLWMMCLRAFFVLYTLSLLTATHWPGLAVRSSFSRIDLVIHLCAFGCWTGMLGLSGWVQLSGSPRTKAIIVGLIGIGFGLTDELTQPLFSRVFDWWDVCADTTGAVLASLALLFIWRKTGTAEHADSLAQSPSDARS